MELRDQAAKGGSATLCSPGVCMSLVTHLLSQTTGGTRGASTVQIPGSRTVPTQSRVCYRATEPCDQRTPPGTPSTCLFSVLLALTGLMLLRRWRAGSPLLATIAISPNSSSIPTGSSLQALLNYSSGTSSTICPKQSPTLPPPGATPTTSCSAFCVPDHSNGATMHLVPGPFTPHCLRTGCALGLRYLYLLPCQEPHEDLAQWLTPGRLLLPSRVLEPRCRTPPLCPSAIRHMSVSVSLSCLIFPSDLELLECRYHVLCTSGSLVPSTEL